MQNQHAAQPHSVFRSTFAHGGAFIIGGSGLPEPNVARLEASPFICFTDGGGAGGAGDAGSQGAGGGTGSGGAGGEKTFTQAEVNAMIAKRAASEIAKVQAEAQARDAATRAELEAVKAQLEDAGKSAAEKAQAQAARERATIEAKLNEQSKALADRDALLAQREQALRDTKLEHELGALFAAKKIVPAAMRAATLVFRADAKIEYDAEGSIVGVDLGTKRFGSVSEAVDDWMHSHGSIYVAPPAGGAGSRAGNAGLGSGKPLHERSDEELIRAANERRGRN